ncbi:MAG: hypothetical protein KDA28_14010, partial [Phycisphaerales bacterium]|nr:hypothetical protein [Phycisphaerales bacterium]
RLPGEVLVAIGLRDADRLVRESRGIVADLQGQPVLEAILATPQIQQARAGLVAAAAASGLDPWTALEAAVGQDVAIGLAPRGDGPPAVVAVVVARDMRLTSRLVRTVHTFSGLDTADGPDPSRSALVEGVTVYHSNETTWHAVLDDAIIVSNDEAIMRRAIDAASGGPGLDDTNSFATSFETIPGDAHAWGWINTDAIRAAVPLERLLQDNAVGGFLVSGWLQTLRGAEQAIAWADVEDHVLEIRTHVSGAADVLDAFVTEASTPSRNLADMPGYIGEISLRRDWLSLFADRESYLTLVASNQLVDFAATASTILGGIDFTDDLLPHIDGPIRLVASRQDFGGLHYQPSPALPAFGLVVPLADVTDGFRQRLESASSIAMSILVVEQAQNGLATYVMRPETIDGHRVITTSYPPPLDDEAGGMGGMQGVRYNFTPAAGVVEDAMFITTSRPLLESLIRASDRTV